MEYRHKRMSRTYFSAFDWILLGIVAVAVSLGAWAILQTGKNGEQDVEIRYRILVEGIPATLTESWQSVSVGSDVTNGQGTAVLGRVVDLEVVPSRRTVVLDGESVTVERSDRVDITVTVTGRGSTDEANGLRILSHRIAAGCTGDFRVGHCYASGARIVYAEARG